jgi:hypothetical protein
MEAETLYDLVKSGIKPLHHPEPQKTLEEFREKLDRLQEWRDEDALEEMGEGRAMLDDEDEEYEANGIVGADFGLSTHKPTVGNVNPTISVTDNISTTTPAVETKVEQDESIEDNEIDKHVKPAALEIPVRSKMPHRLRMKKSNTKFNRGKLSVGALFVQEPLDKSTLA